MSDDELADDIDEYFYNIGITEAINDIDPLLMGHLDINAIDINSKPIARPDIDFLQIKQVIDASQLNIRPLVWFTINKCGVSFAEIGEAFGVTEKEVSDEISIFQELNS